MINWFVSASILRMPHASFPIFVRKEKQVMKDSVALSQHHTQAWHMYYNVLSHFQWIHVDTDISENDTVYGD